MNVNHFECDRGFFEKRNSLKISEEDALDTEESREDTVEADQQEVFNKHKFELSKNINNALNETQLSLDFVSLISSVKPSLAKSTISPHLSKFVKPTSLNSDRLGQDSNDNQESKTTDSFGQGWKLSHLEDNRSFQRS